MQDGHDRVSSKLAAMRLSKTDKTEKKQQQRKMAARCVSGPAVLGGMVRSEHGFDDLAD